MSGTEAAAKEARSERDKRLAAMDFDRSPFVIAWELTRACCLLLRALPSRRPAAT